VSNAIRDVTIRVRIDQQETKFNVPDFDPWLTQLNAVESKYREISGAAAGTLIPKAEMDSQASGFRSIADAVRESSDATSNASLVTMDAALANHQTTESLIQLSDAESTAKRAIDQTTVSRKAQSIENINGAGNALRAAAASRFSRPSPRGCVWRPSPPGCWGRACWGRAGDGESEGIDRR
jgi:hypothetical protein